MSSEWMTSYELVKKFAIKNGHCTLPEDYYVQGRNLQSWVQNQKQRRRTGRLEIDRIHLMEKLPGWRWDVHGGRWDQSFQLLKSYIDKGGTLPPKKDEKYQGLHISTWIITQRKKYRSQKLSEEQSRKLSALPNWQWEIETDSWEQGLLLLEQYIFLNNTSLVPDTCIFGDFPLGRWVGSQRKKYKNGALMVQRIEILETLADWSWDPRLDTWETMFDSLVAYSKLTGSARLPTNLIYNGLNLGMWASRQRTIYKKAQLHEWQIEKLASLSGWTWNLSDESWRRSFKCLVDYVRINGHSNVRGFETVGEINLGDWVQKQRQAKKKNTLSDRQIQMLETIDGWEWQKTSGSGSRSSIKSD